MCDRALHWKHCAIAISHGRPRLLLTMSSSVSVKSAPHNNAFLVTPAMQCNAMQHNTTHPMDFSSFLQFSVTLQPNATQQNTYILWHSQCNATYLIRGRPPNIFLTCFKIIALLQFPGETAIHGIVDDKLGSFLVQLVGTRFTRGHLLQAAQRATTMSCQHQCEIVKSPNVFCCRKIVLCPLSVEGKWCSFWSKASPPRVVCCELLNVWYFLYKMCKLLNVKYLVWEMCKLLNALCVALWLAGCEMGRVNLCKTCQHLSQWQPVQYCQRRHHLQQQLRHHHLQWHHMVIVIKTTRLRQM